MRRSERGALCLLLALAASGAWAQRATLPEALRERIATLPSAQRDVFYRRAAALSAMTPAQRDAFRRRLAEWKALPERERRERRERWQAWQALPAPERARVLSAAQAYAALPVAEQLDLRARYAQLDDTDRRGWRLGPTLGRDWTRLQPLLLQVPPAQREPLLQALRAMTPQQREDLGVLAQRTPPQQRDRLRRELLAQPASRRGSWLVVQLER
jgi:hypothetical protein